VLATIPNGTVVSLLLQGDDWCKVSYGIYLGYVQTQYLTIVAASTTSTTQETADTTSDNTEDSSSNASYSLTAWVDTASGSLNMRETASSDAIILVKIPQYEEIEVLSDISATWCKANYENVIGYVMTAYLTTTKPDVTAQESAAISEEDTQEESNDETDTALPMDSTLHTLSTEITAYVRPPASYAALGLYEACSESSDLLTSMYEGETVNIVRAGDTWCEVEYGNRQGYCLRDGLSFFEE